MRSFPRFFSLLFFVGLTACVAPRVVPQNLAQLKTPDELGRAAQQMYAEAKAATEKKEKLRLASLGIAYSEKCLHGAPEHPSCLYFQTLSMGVYIRNHILNYQKGLRKMVANCETLNRVQPEFEHAGCLRILGNIYAQAPSFSISPKNISQDLDRSVDYLQQAVKLAPGYALNHLFLARSLEEVGQKEQARLELETFDRFEKNGIEKDYPEWKKVRDALAQKLL